MKRSGYSIVFALLAAWSAVAANLHGEDVRETEVGMPARIDQLVLSGGELEAKPLEDRRAPLVVRIVNVFAHGDSHRYDLEYYALEPGKFDLRDALQRKDGSSLDDLPPIDVAIIPTLPAGQVRPNALELERAKNLGGYRTAWVIGGVIWFIGLFAIFLWGRRKTSDGQKEEASPQTLADRLRPMVEQAIRGDLAPAKLAELERLLVAFWRRRLNLDNVQAAQAIETMRQDQEAGALLQQLEYWLHHPEGGSAVDVAELLEPYQDMPPDALDPFTNA